jgi:hypothetical protein
VRAGITEIRGEAVVAGQANIVRCGDDDVGDHPPLRLAIRSASTRDGTPPAAARVSAINASVVDAR